MVGVSPDFRAFLASSVIFSRTGFGNIFFNASCVVSSCAGFLGLGMVRS